MSDQFDRQLDREAAQVAAGLEAYRKHVEENDLGSLPPGQQLTARATLPLSAAISELIASVEAGRAGRGRPVVAHRYLVQLDPDAVAYITARHILSCAGDGAPLTRTCMKLSALLEEQYRLDELRVEAPALLRHMEGKAQKWTTAFHRRAIMRKAADLAGVAGLDWSDEDRLLLGFKLVEMFIQTTGLARTVRTKHGTKTTRRLVLTDETISWITRYHSACELMQPRYTPMVVPPVPWTSPISGGYLTRENRTPFVRDMADLLRDDLFSLDLSDVYGAVNAAQSTAWAINRSVLDVLREAWAAGSKVAGLPSVDPEPLPPRPADVPTDVPYGDLGPAQQARLNEWRTATARVHDSNASLISKRMAVIGVLSMAEDVAGEEAIYFPHNLDFRGRMYSIVPGLSPQGDDLARGLLQFADGKPFGEFGGYWLAVHIANLFGVDKCSFDDRVAWVQEHSADLVDSALRPLDGAGFWQTADKPWQALAACYEWLRLRTIGPEAMSYLPVAVDGSCSGLQHYSAMLRDPVGGAAVNLVPSPTPADIYTAVAERVEEILAGDLPADDQLGRAWRGQVTRQIVKRPCMTFAYSVTSRGMQDQILDELRKAVGQADYLPGWDNFAASRYLGPVVDRAIRETVVRAAEGMDWLKSVARTLVTTGTTVAWTTPDGFPVVQRYMRTQGRDVNCWFEGSRIRLKLRVEGRVADLTKQCSAIAPNLVHSLDGAHLRAVVRRLFEDGVTESVAVVHDSFAVHACDVDFLQAFIRTAFADLYSGNMLRVLADRWLEQVPEGTALPMPPMQGDLDLEGVLRSDYFFA